MKNKIVLTAESDLKDNELRAIVEKLWTKVETINERTKEQTRSIKQIEKTLKKEKSINKVDGWKK